MDNNNGYSCDTILSLIQATNIISRQLTVSKNLDESINSIFDQLKTIPNLKKTWVFNYSDNDSFRNIYSFNAETTDTIYNQDNELYSFLNSQKYSIFNSSENLPEPIKNFFKDNHCVFILPSTINNELLASTIVLFECKKEDSVIICELFDIIFTKLGAILARLDFERMLKEQHTNQNNLLAGIEEMLFIVNDKGRIIHFNNAVQRTLGYNEEELSEMSVFDMLHPDDVENAREEIQCTFCTNHRIFYLPYYTCFKKAIPAETTISTGIWNSKPIFIMMARNLTEFENARNEIVLAKIKADQANKAKSQFLRKMSHQFRVPLNSILGMSELLMKTDLNQKQFNFHNVILKSTENLLGILNDILDFSKIENNELTLDIKNFNLKDVIQLTINSSYYSIQNKGVELLSNYGKYGNDNFIKGDPLRLYQVLMNLTQFCAVETEKGKIEIQITENQLPDYQTKLTFIVKDTSKGLTEYELNELTQNIANGQYESLNQHKHSGLGLSIAWHLVNLMGGKLNIVSNEQGNTFEFSLIFNVCETDDIKNLQETKTSGKHELPQNFRILLAEDQVFNQMVVQAMVEDWGFQIDIAENGEIALEKLNKNPMYNLILMDIQMPVMDGMEATRKIRNEFSAPVSDIPIIAITAHAYADEHKKFLAAGMNDTITKPFRSQILFQKIASCLGISKTIFDNNEPVNELYIPTSTPSEPLYDLTVVKNITKGNKEAFNKMINVFLEKSKEELAYLKDAIKNNDWVTIANTAHKMKPALAYMGMKKLEQEINDLYFMTKNNPKPELAQTVVNSVENKLNKVFDLLKNEIE
jgi:PAS domain S-box-containing protein